MKTITKTILVSVMITTFGYGSASASTRESRAKESERAIKTLAVAATVFENVSKKNINGIPQELIDNSEAVVIFPGACKIAAGAYNSQGGKGVAMIRDKNGSWSHPFFVIFREGSMEHNSGNHASDLVLFFSDRNDIMKIDQAEIILGDNIKIEAGPVNRDYPSNENTRSETQIYAYQGSEGHFTGANLKGGVLSHHSKLSGSVYGVENISLEEIINGNQVSLNPDMNNLMVALTCLVSK